MEVCSPEISIDCCSDDWIEDSSDEPVEEDSLNREESMSGGSLSTITYASLSMESSKVTNEGNCSLLRYSVYGVERKNVFPYELSDAVLDENIMEEKERMIVEVDLREDKSRYIPPPL